jgi:hypothetical protein
MRYIGSLTSSASGKAGGIVAYSSATGSHFRIRPTRVTTRSTAVSCRRNIFQAITAAWRSLTPAQRAAWDALATGKATGFNLFTSRNLNLWDIGLSPTLAQAQAAPTFPAIAGFTVAPKYGIGSPLPTLAGFNVSIALSALTTFTARLRATPAYSNTRAFIRRGEFRTLATFTPSSGQQVQPIAEWNTIFGTYPTAGAIIFTLDLTDPATGARAPAVRTRCSYQGTEGGGNLPGTIGLIMPSGLIVDEQLQAIYVGPTLIAEP